MILILSSINNEETTNQVIDWLDRYNADYLRINGHDLEGLSDISITLGSSGVNVAYDKQNDLLESIKVIWNRKWRDDDFYFFLDENKAVSPYLRKQIGTHLSAEFFAGTRALQIAFENKKWLTKPTYLRGFSSKLHILKIANSLGLTTPNTLVTNNKKVLKKFIESEKVAITKSLSEMEVFLVNRSGYALYTTQVLEKHLNNFPEQFFPSLFQKMIEKEYEIRTFYIQGSFYSMAIFSQARKGTKLDFRQYDFSNPTRQVPYKLPKKIEKKLDKLLNLLDINCASLDLIKGKDGKYYFLEINPTGQFGMVSIPCNYYLEEIVAQRLINEDK